MICNPVKTANMPKNVEGDSLMIVVPRESAVITTPIAVRPTIRIGILVDRYRRALYRLYSGTSLDMA